MTVKVKHGEQLHVYGLDNPLFTAAYQAQANSVALLVESSALTETSTGKFTFTNPVKLKDKLSTEHGYLYGEEEPFGEEPSIYGGSAFLITPYMC